MAESVQIDEAGSKAKLRNPVFVGVITVVTLNLYSLYWWYAINRELATLARQRDLPKVANRPWLALLAFSGVYIAVFAAGAFLSIAESYEYGEEPSWVGTLDFVWIIALAIGVITTFATAIKTFKRVKHAQASFGVTRDQLANGPIFAVCFLVITPVAYGYLQQELNKAWRVVRGDAQPVSAQAYFVPPQAKDQPPLDPA